MYICRNVDKTGEFTGDDITYIYPDFHTVLSGSFKSGHLLSAKECRLVGCTFVDGIAHPKCSDPVSQQEYTFDAPSRTSIGSNPTLPDPWEAAKVQVGPSLLPQGGEGLFAKTAIKVCILL